jgi:phosphoglycerate dehydrogenase-like enzyme
MLDYSLFSSMGKCAAFINTGRGAQVVEADLARALRDEPSRCALLDVTWPEPCPKGHEFWSLPNVFITPHIAGMGLGDTRRMSDYILEEIRRYKAGEPLRSEVTLPMLATMA